MMTNKLIKEMFMGACEMICSKVGGDSEFDFCVRNIHIALEYFKSERIERKKRDAQNAEDLKEFHKDRDTER